MKFFALIAAAVAGMCVSGSTNVVVETEDESGLKVNAGADLRIRQEIMHNVIGLPGCNHSMMPKTLRKNINHFRIRPRAWGRLDYKNFALYVRAVDEFREHVVKNGVRRDDRAYTFPDEIILDNLYFEGRSLFDGFMDFRLGRQDLFDGKHSTLGLERIMQEGTPFDGSRSCFADMARFTFYPTDTSKLDVFALYNNGRSIYRWGNSNSEDRPLNAINPGCDNHEMDEWGGGAVWNDSLFDKQMPYQLFVVHKSTTSYSSKFTENGITSTRRIPKKQITTLGLHVMPQINEYLSLDLEGAKQFGTKGKMQAGGWMGYGAVDYHWNGQRDTMPGKSWYPYAMFSVYYLSGDKHRDGIDDNDTAWDPMWARATYDSEFMQYGTLYGLGYWENLLYPKLTFGADLGKHHSFYMYSGPMFAAVQDHLGHADGSGGGMYKGWMSAACYSFPVILAPKNATGVRRFEVYGHMIAELFNPGDYYDCQKPATFFRWQIMVKF